MYEDIAKVWDEISFVKPAETEVEKMNRTYLYEKDKVKNRLILMRDKLKSMYSYQYPIQRRVVEERLTFLQKEFDRFDYIINPYHIQPGLLLDVDICSIKRKKATLDGMANVLNEFLHGVSKGFQDAAFASLLPPPLHGARGYRPVLLSERGRARGGRRPAPIISRCSIRATRLPPSPSPSRLRSASRLPASAGPSPRASWIPAKRPGGPRARASRRRRGRPGKNEDGGLRQL